MLTATRIEQIGGGDYLLSLRLQGRHNRNGTPRRKHTIFPLLTALSSLNSVTRAFGETESLFVSIDQYTVSRDILALNDPLRQRIFDPVLDGTP
jgi:hypothetical protein